MNKYLKSNTNVADTPNNSYVCPLPRRRRYTGVGTLIVTMYKVYK